MRRYFLALSLAVAGCFAPSDVLARPMTQVSPNIRIGFGPSKQGETGLDTEFIKFVDGARKTLHGAFFEIRLDSVVDAFIRAFKEKHTHVDCRDLLGCDIYTPENRAKMQAGEFKERCRGFVRSAATLLEESGY